MSLCNGCEERLRLLQSARRSLSEGDLAEARKKAAEVLKSMVADMKKLGVTLTPVASSSGDEEITK
jgi:hypothetical protein